MTAPRQGLPLPAKLALAVVPAAFLLAAPLLIKPLGYLFEESFPTRFELPHSIVDVDSASGTPRLLLAHGEHDSAPGWHFVSGRWWPRFALTDGERAWPLLTDNYQGAWPYYLLLLLPESARNLDGQRQLAAFLGALTLLLLFVAIRRHWGNTAATFVLCLAPLNSMLASLLSSTFLYESLQVPCVLGLVALSAPSPAGTTPSRRTLFLAGLMVGLTGSLKLTGLVPALVLALVLHGRPLLARRSLLPFLLGLALPLLPYALHEIHALATGVPESSMLYSLLEARSNLRNPARIPIGIAYALLSLVSLPFGNPDMFAALYHELNPHDATALLSALGGAAALVWTLVRTWRDRSASLERGILAAGLAVVAVSGLLYGRGLDFQGFLPILPLLLALIVRAALAAPFPLRSAAIAAVAALLLGQLAASRLEFPPSCHSAACRTPQQAVARLIPPRASVVSTAYNQVGMVRFFRGDTVRSLDASLMLRRAQDAAAIAAAWTSLLPAMPADALYLFEMTPMGLDESADAQYSAAGTGPPPALVGFLAAAKATGQAPVRVGESACQLASRRDCPLALYRLATAPPPRP